MLGPGQGNYTLLHGELGAFRCQGGGTGPEIWSPLVTPSTRLDQAPQQLGGTPLWFLALQGKGARFRRIPSFSLSGRGFFSILGEK